MISTAMFAGACVDAADATLAPEQASVSEAELVGDPIERCPDIVEEIPVAPQGCIVLTTGQLGVKDCHFTVTVHRRYAIERVNPVCVSTSVEQGPVICGPCHSVLVP